MPIHVDLKSAASPSAVLNAIRDDLREWRESAIPRDVWDTGVLQVMGKVEGSEFHYWYSLRWRRGKGPVLRGVVIEDAGSGSIIRGRCGFDYYLWAIPAAVALYGFYLFFAGRSGAAFPFVIVTVLAVVYAVQGASMNGSDAQTAYLVSRLERAVDAASTTKTPTT